MKKEAHNFFAERLRETLDGVGASQKKVARSMAIPAQHLSEMKLGKRRCTVEYDLRLARYFGTNKGFWLRLQLDYDLMLTEREKGREIEKIIPVV